MIRKYFFYLAVAFMSILASCKKDKTPVDQGIDINKIITIKKNFPELNLNFQYKFSESDSTVSEATVSGDFYFLDKSTTFYIPNSSEYFTIRTQHNTNPNIQCLVSGTYNTKNDSLQIFYVKVDLSKPNPFEN